AGCCGQERDNKQIVIDFLYLDLSVCKRCRGAETNLDKALEEVSGLLKAAGFDITVNKINITSKEMAVKHRFVSSPTIRINGTDIDLEVKETTCAECGDLCGDSVDCRVWTYEDIEYSEPPKAMIINAILRAVYSRQNTIPDPKSEYRLPDNLKRFFDGLEKKT
ncbi:MAG: DUF2703 domain-containing protein, partial [Clostridiales bacterium]|nr:DUF2703 domain-containing protein [Clostridiales bacterium]